MKKIWLITFRRPVNPTAGFDRVIWCTAEFMASRKIDTNIVYCKLDSKDTAPTKEQVSGITLYGIPCGGNILTKNLDFIRKTTELVKYRAGPRDTFLLCGAMPLALAGNLKSISRKFNVAYYTFGSSVEEFRSILPELLRLAHVRKIRMMLLNIFTEKTQLKNTDMVIVPHELAREEFKAQLHYRKKMAVVPYGQDIYKRLGSVKPFSSPEIGKKKVLLFIGGRAWDRKGAIYIVRAFAELKRKVPSILVMTGVRDEKILAEAEALGLKVGRDILTPGLVDDKTLASLYKRCDLFTHPSLHEGFSQPVIEVMAFGKPVVASRLAAYPSVRDSREGYVIDPTDTRAYSAKLELLMSNRKLFDKMSKSAAARAKEYEWQTVSLKLLHALED